MGREKPQKKIAEALTIAALLRRGSTVHSRSESRPEGDVGAESSIPVFKPTGAVFLSYASEDAPAAERIAFSLRSAGIEVWFDKSELRGGDRDPTKRSGTAPERRSA